ncbi:unnamed protein product [Polarella glacialis]|uniref:GH16 domain-containing protein n=1 Tax=Polarella glacialis TaxID=89957 RepID=A0A813IWH3_POLGL|nr:unnamed protein product [Polarella glacialis]
MAVTRTATVYWLLLVAALLPRIADSSEAEAEAADSRGRTLRCAASPNDSRCLKPSTDHSMLQVNYRGGLSSTLVQQVQKADCCSGCPGKPFCSPQSQNCYLSKNKDYYRSCSEAGDGGLAPAPPPGDGGLAPAPAQGGGFAECCAACAGGFCSPISKNCYTARAKDYYEKCGGVDDAVELGEMVWSDEFDDVTGSGRVNSSNWRYNNGDNPNNQELQYYTDKPDNSHLQDGVLKITAKCENYKDKWSYTSARLVTKDLADWGPGHRVHVRAKLPTGRGTWPAIWMLPSHDVYGGWPNSGEIDIVETVGCTSGKVYGTVHTGAYNHMKNTQKGSHYFTDFSEWHNYTIDWLDSHMKWYVDGQLYHTFAPDTGSSDRWPFSQKFYLILNVAVGGSWGGFCLSGGPSCSQENEFGTDQTMQVDFVRIHKLIPKIEG